MVTAVKQGMAQRSKSTKTDDMLASMLRDGSIDLGMSAFDLAQLSAFANSEEFDEVVKSLPSVDKDDGWNGNSDAKRMNKANSLDVFKRRYISMTQPKTGLVKLGMEEETTSQSGDTTVKGDDPQNHAIIPVNFAGFSPSSGPTRRLRSNVEGTPSMNTSSDDIGSGTPRALLEIAQKKQRRMLSNRESARRSRKRKQEMMMELEGQVCNLTNENEKLKKKIMMLEHALAKKDAELQKAKNL